MKHDGDVHESKEQGKGRPHQGRGILRGNMLAYSLRGTIGYSRTYGSCISQPDVGSTSESFLHRLQRNCSLVMSMIPVTIVTVPSRSQRVMVSPKKIMASMVAKRGAVLNSGVARATPAF